MAATPSQQTLIANIYVALFNRAPDANGFEFWTQALANGASPAAITASFVTSPEAQTIYPVSQTAEQFVSAFYQTVFGRPVDAGGLAFWSNVLNGAGGPRSDAARSELVTKIVALASTPLPAKPADLTDAQYAQTVADRDLFGKKVVAAVDFGLNARSNDLSLAKQVLAAVGAPPAPAPTPTPPADPFAFTTGTDALSGTAGDDTFTADNSNPAARTLSAGDSANGGLGTDTLRYLAAATDTALIPGALTSIEKLRIIGGGALVVDASGSATLTDVEFETIGGALRVNLLATQRLTITGNNGAAVQAVRAVYGATDEVAQLVLKGSGKAGAGNASATTMDGLALRTLNLSVAGAAGSFIDLYDDNSSLRTLNITGDGNLSLSAVNGRIETIDASVATGNMTISHARATAVTIKAGNGADAITGGTGDDTIAFAAGKLTTGDSVDGGAGRDTLQIHDTVPVYGAINAATGIEVLSLATSGATVDVGQLTTIQNFAVANTGTATFTNAKSTSTFTIDNSAGVTAVAITNAAGQTAMDITLTNHDAVPSARAVGSLTIGGATNVSLTSSGIGTNSNVITTLSNSDATTITVKGSAALTFGAAAGAVLRGTVDASAFTGQLTVLAAGTTSALNIIGGSASDTIQAGTAGGNLQGNGGGDLITLGGGVDRLVYKLGSDSVQDGVNASGTAAGKMDTVTGFQSGVDKIDLTVFGLVPIGGGAFHDKPYTLFSDLEAAQVSPAFYIASSMKRPIIAAHIGADTYLVVDADKSGVFNLGGDLVIKLAGTTTIAAADILI
jgi:hypothetical protein